MLTIAFTGHRPNKLGNDYDLVSPRILNIKQRIVSYINSLVADKIKFIVGGALGIDTLAALIAIELGIEFDVYVPCRNQDKMWTQKSKDLYQYILSKATRVYYVHEGEYNNTCMQKRNIAMVDDCDMLIAVWDGTSGGTANCVKYARSIGKETIIFKP